MKLLLNLLFLLLAWFTNLVSAIPAFSKLALSTYELSFSKAETKTAEKELLFKTGSSFKVDMVGFSPNPDDYMTPLKTIWLKEL